MKSLSLAPVRSLVLAGMLCSLTGCTLLQPWTQEKSSEPAITHHPEAAVKGSNLSSQEMAGNLPALLAAQRLQPPEEERRVVQQRMQMLEATVLDQERALSQANNDMKAATDEVARARKELQQWKSEMAGLRDRLRNSEKENLATLQSMVALVEQMVDHEHADKGMPDSKDEVAPLEMPRRVPSGSGR